MGNQIEVKLCLNADEFLKSLKEIEESLKRIEQVGHAVKVDCDIMRKITEIKNEQSFVSLSPTITIKTEENDKLDIDTIIANITDRLEQQFSSSTKSDQPMTTLKAESKITPEGKVAITINIDEEAIGCVTTDEFERSIQQCVDDLRMQTMNWRCL